MKNITTTSDGERVCVYLCAKERESWKKTQKFLFLAKEISTEKLQVSEEKKLPKRSQVIFTLFWTQPNVFT